eukprot:FR741605.1.p1 GENE.FR741605.1~~FR741605.1.p1  ORF type:complete len:118 (-),score=0.08 FR741605.1:86-439(-)
MSLGFGFGFWQGFVLDFLCWCCLLYWYTLEQMDLLKRSTFFVPGHTVYEKDTRFRIELPGSWSALGVADVPGAAVCSLELGSSDRTGGAIILVVASIIGVDVRSMEPQAYSTGSAAS